MDTNEYNQTVTLYADKVYRFALKHTRNATEAEDVVQNAYEVLWRNHLSVAIDKAKAYLFTVAHRQSIDHWRRNQHTEYVEQFTEGAAGAATAAPPDLMPTLTQALQQLSDIQRSVVLLRDYEGYNYAEIAEITQLTESQVKVYIFRARKKLQEIIGQIDNLI